MKMRSRMPGNNLDIHRLMLLMNVGMSLPAAMLVTRYFGAVVGTRCALGVLGACSAQHAFVWGIQRRTGIERPTGADLLTLGRMAAGSALAGLTTARVDGRACPARWAACLMTLGAGSVLDWVDGPLARKLGPTRLGAVLDIEADSWLTFWAATAAVTSHVLPGFCLLPPVARYLLPAVEIGHGGLPQGGGPWWSRATGIAQMVIIIAALAPVWKQPAPRPLRIVAGLISASQAITIAVLLIRQLRRGEAD